jgi:hypothetical protein
MMVFYQFGLNILKILMNKNIFVVCRCHNGQKYSARHPSEFWPDSTGNFVRRPHVGPSRMRRINGFK